MSQGPYHLVSLGILLLSSYFVSLILLRFRLITLPGHRKFWNTLLLLFFLSTAFLGIFLVIKVNYKLDVPWVEQAMQWHVDSGIGFAIVAVFHLIWHSRYYLRKDQNNRGDLQAPLKESRKAKGEREPYTRFQRAFFFVLLGYVSIMSQLVLLREFLKNFHGNELVIGLFLAAWMMLTALGARLGSGYQSGISKRKGALMLMVMGVMPLLVYLLLILLRAFLFLPGLQPGLLDTLISIGLLLGPLTLLSGFLFGSASRTHHMPQNNAPYMLDALGSVAGGILLSAILVHFLNNLQLLTFLMLSTTAGVVLVLRPAARSLLKWIILPASGILFFLSLFDLVQNTMEGIKYKNADVLESRDTPYGNLTFTKSDAQISAFMDGNPVLSSNDLSLAEEAIHYPALQLERARSFLLLGGGLSGHISEAAKYNPEVIDYCETDPKIYSLGKKYFPEPASFPYRFIPEDGRSWLRKSSHRDYDVIISSFAGPHSLGSNRYFTVEFYRLVKKHLSANGVFCMHLSTADSYVNEEGLSMLGINEETLRKVFPHVLLVPGRFTYFLASDNALSLDFPHLLSKKEISTTYVHPDYLDAGHIRFDSDQLTLRIQELESKINSDLWPRLFFFSLQRIHSKSGKNALEISGICAALLFLILFFRYRHKKRAIYVTGFTGAGIQIILIMVMQSFYGFAYLMAPLMITLFLSGIIAGILSWRKIGKPASKQRIIALMIIMALVALSGILIPLLEGLFKSRTVGLLILGLLNFIPGLLVGWVYTMGCTFKDELSTGIAGELYSADLAGAALGTLLPAIFLLPLIGVINTFILLFCINIIAGFSLWIKGPS